ncbi:receptor protein kinase [Salix suchowensis]|nr:receptor protein kinase [Salix suchowensis]
MGGESMNLCKLLFLLLGCVTLGYSVTDPNDLKILLDFQKGLENPELLKWPANGDDPCGPPLWPHVFCSNGRVTQIQVQNMGLKGSLPQNFNQLSKLYNIGLQRNNFTGKLPTFKGLSELEFAFLDYNNFDTIPSDFFVGLGSIRSTGWSLPSELADSVQLTNFSAFGKSLMSTLLLNNQEGGGMSGPIDVIASMTSLSQLWLHGNSFTGTIPENIGDLSLLRDLNLNGNKLAGLVPQSLADMQLDNLDLNNNQLMGPVPNFKAGKVSYESNPFCQSKPGAECAPEVNALLEFLGGVNYPSILTSQWSGNDPCQGPWLGLNCDLIQSPSIAKLDSLIQIGLGGNSLKGTIPSNFTNLNSLRLLDVSGNNLGPPLPKFQNSVKLVVVGNPLLDGGNQTQQTPSPASNPPPEKSPPSPSTMPFSPPSPPSSSNTIQRKTQGSKLVIVGGILAGSLLAIVLIALSLYCCFKKRKETSKPPSSIVVHPRDPSDPENFVKIAISSNTNRSLSTLTGTSSVSNTSGLTENSSLAESGNVVISVQVLRKVTDNFSQKNQLGSGGFGIVYKGELDDGTKIAVKRMEAGVMGSKAGGEFQAEIAVLTKVRHRHLVSLLGFSIEGSERLLVYEYMPQGALSMHLFHWKKLNLEPLSWMRRLSIALDVARGVEYLHSLARQTFIHRDLKSSNILLGDDFHAKVSDFGLVKLAPDREQSVATRLAGTFGYLAPEYAVMGKITTKVDVFSYGVVLMELLTGLTALDEERSEESRYWLKKLMAAIDPALNVDEETFESISTIAELAGHCTSRDPNHRPDMGHAVNVLGPLVEKWKPVNDESEDFYGIDYNQPLPQMLKVWQDADSTGLSYTSLSDSKGSIPARPAGFAESSHRPMVVR